MIITQSCPTVSPGDQAPNFVLPAVDGSGTVSLGGHSRKGTFVPRPFHWAMVPILSEGARPLYRQPSRHSRHLASKH